MDKFKRSILILGTVILSIPLLTVGTAFAKGSFPGSFSTKYGSSIGCDYCHPNNVTSQFNSYGQDLKSAYNSNGKNLGAAFTSVEPLDSDGDGFTNLDEITAGTLPYDGNSVPVVVGPTCTDNDGDGYALEGGQCGPVDCNDNDSSINPGATESCTDGVDNNCNGKIDAADPAAVSCPATNPLGERFGIFRSGKWYLDANHNGMWDAGTDTTCSSFGLPTDIPVVGDWQGSGQEQIGAYRNGAWYLDTNGNGAWDSGIDTKFAAFGGALNDVPVAGDWNGNGITQVGVYRGGKWYLDANGNGAWDAGSDTVYPGFGMSTDIPVTGDWNGDGITQIGVYRDGTWYLDANGNGAWDAGIDTVASFGLPTDIPVVGDWDNDGTTEIGVYRNGKWYLDINGNGAWDAGIDMVYSAFGGMQNDIPVALK